MTHYIEAKKLVSENAGAVFKIFMLTFALGIVSSLLSYVPLLGGLIVLAFSLFSIVFEIYALNKLVLDKTKLSVGDLLKEAIDSFKKNGTNTLIAYLIFMCMLMPVIFIVIFILILPVVFTATSTSASDVSIIGAFIASLIVLIPIILLIIAYSTFLSFKLTYKVAGYILGIETDEIRKAHNTDCLKMSAALTGLALIPIIGWIASIIFDYIFTVKIILDVTES